MLDFPALGPWHEGQVRGTWAAPTRPIIAEVEQAIEKAWARAGERKNVHLFNGPMCRLESFKASSDALELFLSPTDYKTFVGTNLSNPALADQYGQAALANGVGLSTSVLSHDGYVLLGRRNERVNYYPSRIHPFSGSLEPGKTLDVFAEIRRELNEELSLRPRDIESILCLGIASDRSIRQPEIMFVTRTRLNREQLQSQLDAGEHAGTWSTRLKAAELMPAMDAVATFTPIGIAALLLMGRAEFGEEWFASNQSTIFRNAGF